MFNKKGLQSVLSVLKLKTLIRTDEKIDTHTHFILPTGVIRDFKDDTCYTVVTSPDPHVSSCELSVFFLFEKFLPIMKHFLFIIKLTLVSNLGSVIHLVCSYDCHAIEEVYQRENHKDTMMVTYRQIMSKLGRSFEANFTKRSRSELCKWCIDILPSYFDLRFLWLY